MSIIISQVSMYACDHCGKGIRFGHNTAHRRGVAGGRWKKKAPKTNRIWMPNLHVARVVESGNVVRRRLCTKCLRRAKRPQFKKKTQESATVAVVV